MGLAAPQHAELESSDEEFTPVQHYIQPKVEPEPYYAYEKIVYAAPKRTYSPVAPKLRKAKLASISPEKPGWNNGTKTKGEDLWSSPRHSYVPK